MSTSFYTQEELSTIGLKSYGNNVLISRKASIYSPEKISVGNNVRIDDFCTLSGRITIRNHIHIASYTAMYAGNYGITIKDFAGISARVTMWAMTDDYSGEYLVGPTVPDEFRNVTGGEIVLDEYATIATGCTILPGVHIPVGAAVGAVSLVHKSLPYEWGFYMGVPCQCIKKRSRKMAELGERLYPPPKRVYYADLMLAAQDYITYPVNGLSGNICVNRECQNSPAYVKSNGSFCYVKAAVKSRKSIRERVEVFACNDIILGKFCEYFFPA